ncbi:NAD(P)-binding protein [Xylariaceae sp. AK1471]|nr:NAD(P)-binding protein [Xylariaceae sp. AK1471]
MAFDPQKDIPNLDGKVILVTGGNTGLGAATIKFLVCQNPSCIYLCARPVSIPQGEALVSEIKSSFPDVNIRVRPLDLSSLANVKKFSADFLKEAERLDLLFLNAGISTTSPALTEDGYESQFGVNHIGHALLTQLLMPKLLETAARPESDVRVLVTTSLAAHLAPPATGLALGSMKEPGPLDSPYQRYANSKLANILFARKLAQVYPRIQCVSFNPGQVKTDLFRKATGINKWFLMTVGMVFMHLTGVSVDKGAENGLWAASASLKDLRNGAYYEPVGILEDQKKFITDQTLADELWDWTNRELEKHGAPGWPEV